MVNDAGSAPKTNTAAIGIDIALVVLFAAIGYQTHAGELTARGAALTAWPFLVALIIGHLIVRALRRDGAWISAGVIVWIVTVSGGMILRQVSGDGTAPAFIAVATAFNAVTLIGWRAIARVFRPQK